MFRSAQCDWRSTPFNHQQQRKKNKNMKPIPKHLPSLFIPICRHFLSLHAWHWFRCALSTTHRPVPAWHLFDKWQKKKKKTQKRKKISCAKNWWQNKISEQKNNPPQMASFGVQVIQDSLQSNRNTAAIKFAFWLENRAKVYCSIVREKRLHYLRKCQFGFFFTFFLSLVFLHFFCVLAR